MPVHEAKDGTRLEPDHVHVIPSAMDIALADGALRLVPRPARRGAHMPIDFFLSTLAKAQGNQAIGIILSGTGSDGTLGCKAIKAAGGVSFAQEPASAKYDGMPKSAIAADCVDVVLPPEGIAREIVRLAREPYVREPPREEGAPEGRDDSSPLQRIFLLLKNATGSDFTCYKKTTLMRRLQRRMVLYRIERLSDYVRRLEGDASEVQALHQDLLISVTSFFRDPETFQALKAKVFPRILEGRSADMPVRLWVPGCATGEEAYSIAICLLESLSELPSNPPLQVFATDLSVAAIEKARAGIYLENIAPAVSAERLSRFFVKRDGRYQVSKPVRELIVFAKQDLSRDPPFSKLDLISCRNVLIYLEAPLQKRVLETFHYALSPTGFLVLGKSETATASSDLFALVDKEHRIYSKRIAAFTPTFGVPDRPAGRAAEGAGRAAPALARAARPADVEREAERVLLARYAPASVLIDEDERVIHFRGDTDAYLGHAQGAGSLDLLPMARKGIVAELRALLEQARASDEPRRRAGVLLRDRGKPRRVGLEVIPIKGPGSGQRSFLVLFEEVGRPPAPLPPAPRGKTAQLRQIAQMEQELQALRHYHRAAEEEQAANNEELQSANEEILSSNEELQSINEELETSKEELQSANEELVTLNEELQNRNVELQRLHDDLDNFIGSAAFPMVMLAPDLAVRRFTPEAARVLSLIPADVGRPLGRLRLGIELRDLERLALAVMETMIPDEREIRDQEGHWWRLQLRPYRTRENTIDGAVVALVDIEALKKTQAVVEEARDFSDAIVSTARVPLLILDAGLRVRQANRSFYEVFRSSPQETEGVRIWELGDRQWNDPKLRRMLEDVLPRDSSFEDYVMSAAFPSVGTRTLVLNGRKLRQIAGKEELILLAVEDRTAAAQAEAERRELLHAQEMVRAAEAANCLKDEFVATASHELRGPLNALVGWAHILSSGTLDEATAARGWAAIKRAVQTQTRLIEDLLNMTRIVTGKLQLSMKIVELLPVVGAAMETARPGATAKGIDLDLVEASGELVLGDPDRLQQVLWNLLSNAVKFTPRGGKIKVSVGRVGTTVRVKVSDTGDGIAPDFLPHVFERFRQAESGPARKYQGLGLGLAIVRQLVELHGGEVSAHSPGKGQGATFVVSLPVPALAAVPPGTEQAEEAEGAEQLEAREAWTAAQPALLRGLRVLVVEDDPDGRGLVTTVMEQCGAEVTAVASAAEALLEFERAPPEIVVSDIGLPGQDGYALIREIRKRAPEEGGRIPALALTAFATSADREEALAAGYQEHLIKPAKPADLVAAVASLTGRTRHS